MAREVHRTAKDVEDAPIDVCAAQRAEPLVQPLGVSAVEVSYLSHAEILKILRDAGPDAGDSLQLHRRCCHVCHFLSRRTVGT